MPRRFAALVIALFLAAAKRLGIHARSNAAVEDEVTVAE
jgi:hypothetical protein